jgi:hypothetical protein
MSGNAESDIVIELPEMGSQDCRTVLYGRSCRVFEVDYSEGVNNWTLTQMIDVSKLILRFTAGDFVTADVVRLEFDTSSVMVKSCREYITHHVVKGIRLRGDDDSRTTAEAPGAPEEPREG